MINKKKKYKLGDFNYKLPKSNIAQFPEKRRDHSKLMVVNRESGEIEHKKFYNIVDYMRKNDLLILNNTRVFPARLFATKDRTDTTAIFMMVCIAYHSFNSRTLFSNSKIVSANNLLVYF